MRHKYGYSVAEMGEVRYKEMLAVRDTLGLDGLEVLDLPDSGLKEMDPRKVELACANHIREIKPDILVTYPVHGISGFHDHLVTHAAVKRVFITLREEGEAQLRRLAFFTLAQEQAQQNQGIHALNYSTEEEIDCKVPISEEDRKFMQDALVCYSTYQDVIQESKVMETIGAYSHYEIFAEEYAPPLDDLTANL
jgi:LmbE family N-acetylglucosaminyl deacetylase